jgi:diguanylate cyclase (GGDEF)-like protein/PAS domain S-box-containing protein
MVEPELSKEVENIESSILFRESLDIIALLEPESGKILRINPAVKRFLGYEPSTLEGEDFAKLRAPKVTEADGQEPIFHGAFMDSEDFLAQDGSICPMDLSVTVIPWGDASVILATLRDVTERKMAEEALRDSEERYALATRGANDGIWDWNLKTNEVYYSERWKAMLGFSTDEIGTTKADWFEKIHPEHQDAVETGLKRHLEGESAEFEAEMRMLQKDGNYCWMLCRGIAVRDSKAMPYRIAGSLTNIHPRKELEAQLVHDAFHDVLTKLPNRHLFLDRLERSLRRAKRNNQYQFAILFLDLDRFKIVNDSLGHQAGDELLLMVAARLETSSRGADTIARLGSDIVARLGGDEFAFLIEDVVNVRDVTATADRIIQSLSQPFKLGNHEIYVSASIGVNLYRSEYQLGSEMLRDADIAMYRAKKLGKGRVEIFDKAMHSMTMASMNLELELHKALEQDQFVLHYQPVVVAKTGQIIGMEALIRWNHPQQGLLSPANFMSLAEEIGIMDSIDRWVLRRACEDNARLLQPGHPPVTVMINLGAHAFQSENLPEIIAETLATTGLEPGHLELEITENSLMKNMAETMKSLARLNAMGIRLAIDDFGTGYSSLSYLKNFPIHVLKIDRSFVINLATDARDAAMVDTIIRLAHSLKLEVIAEGVETLNQQELLRSRDCDYLQGYFFSKPVPFAEIQKLIGDQWTASPQG